jgi:RNA polymerase sigma-70 factor (ECF subfamily)
VTPLPTDPAAAVEAAWRTERVAVVATVARRLGDLQAAEDAVQEAFAAAAHRWPRDGVPDRPGAWLTTTAWRKALDAVRRDRFPVPARPGDPAQEATMSVHAHGTDPADGPDPVLDLAPVARDDDVLSLILTCCHPALSSDAQVALTLRHVTGLTDRQIAARFLVSEATMTKRLVRARAKIRDAGIRFDLPDRTRLHERLDQVHATIYLLFTEGHLASGPETAVRAELCDEAVWLARQLHRLLPDDPETTGLLALLLLQHARTPARLDATGRLLAYAEQDRARWDGDLVDQARTLLARTIRGAPDRLGPYQLQAAIALLHTTADAEPDWAAVAGLYAALARVAPSPVVEINRAVAVGRAHGPAAGLAVLDPIIGQGRYATYLPLLAARADLLERTGDPAAADAWRDAARHATNPDQRAHLLGRARSAGS